MRVSRRVVVPLALVVFFAAAPLAAWAARLDDSGTYLERPVIPMRWASVSPGHAVAANVVSGESRLHVRLNVHAYRGHTVRIQLVMPASRAGALTASWTTQGPLLGGQIQAPGQAIVYSGPITTDFLEDTWRLHLSADGRRLERNEQIDFAFDIEVMK